LVAKVTDKEKPERLAHSDAAWRQICFTHKRRGPLVAQDVLAEHMSGELRLQATACNGKYLVGVRDVVDQVLHWPGAGVGCMLGDKADEGHLQEKCTHAQHADIVKQTGGSSMQHAEHCTGCTSCMSAAVVRSGAAAHHGEAAVLDLVLLVLPQLLVGALAEAQRVKQTACNSTRHVLSAMTM